MKSHHAYVPQSLSAGVTFHLLSDILWLKDCSSSLLANCPRKDSYFAVYAPGTELITKQSWQASVTIASRMPQYLIAGKMSKFLVSRRQRAILTYPMKTVLVELVSFLSVHLIPQESGRGYLLDKRRERLQAALCCGFWCPL